MMIYNAVVCPMDKPQIPNGFVAWDSGGITQVGDMSQCPAPVPDQDVDAQGGYVLPGFVDVHCHLGLLADGLSYDEDDCNEVSAPCTPQLRAIDALYPLDHCFQEAREAGVTTVLTSPGSANAIGGQIAAIKTVGRWADDMVVLEPAAMKFALGENPKKTYSGRNEAPATRMATAALMREQLRKALEYAERISKHEADPENEDAPDYDAALEALVPVVQGKLPVHFHAHRADDIATALRIAKEFHLNYVLIHATEGYLVADILAREGARAVVGPIIGDRSKPELAHQRVTNAARLVEAGVPVAICTDHSELPIQYLLLSAALAAGEGMNPEAALKAITLTAAELGGIAHRVGSLTPGKDADIVLCSGHPFELNTKVQAVFINGTPVKSFHKAVSDRRKT